EAERGARALLGRFEPGDRVAVWAPSIAEWVLLEFAAGLAGLTLVTVNPANGPEEVRHVLGHSGARGVFCVPQYRGNSLPAILGTVRGDLPELREVISLDGWQDFAATGDPAQRLPEVDPADPAQILYTSGTTGLPKAAVLPHGGITNNARLVFESVGITPGEAAVNPMPLFHIAGCGLHVLGIAAGLGTHVLMPHFDPGLELELIETFGAAGIGGVPTMLHALIARSGAGNRELPSLRYGFSGGAPVSPDLARQMEETFGVPMLITFAQTESCCSMTVTRTTDSPGDRAGTVGRPLPQTEVKITDPVTGATLAPGLPGEICTRGYLVMKGYLNDPAATAATTAGCTPATWARWTSAGTARSSAGSRR
ncbi:MAG TPA: long-chain fatty acid--CoA ligase, partial [Streptosporangiaceae bacterium]|nr:long-chain fatty acid--CoA ligase [Streptosporangiaceae bacterium]